MSYGLYNSDPVIRTFTGKWVNVYDFKCSDICIEDIAHALSMQCRFGGHLPVFYSVAQHSIKCSLLVDRKFALEALLHDASEAYLLDIPRPIKQRLDNYKALESQIQALIGAKFNIPFRMIPEVKIADEQCLLMEWNGLMIAPHRCIAIMTPADAEDTFLKRFNELTLKS